MKKMYAEVEDTLTAVGIVTGFYALMALVAWIA